MQLIKPDEYKQICFNVLVHFDLFCKKNNLQYSLTAGTLLGAVRHKGFIPWDDDIDVIMTRPDYNRLMELYDNSGKYKLVSHSVNNVYYYPFAKIYDSETILIENDFDCGIELGAYIDIFPVDGNGNDEHKARRHLMKCIEIQHKLNHTISKHFFQNERDNIVINYIKKARYNILKLIGKEYMFNKLETMLNKYDYDSSNYVANNAWCTYGVRELLEKNVYLEYTEMVFEGQMFPVIKQYDVLLKALYGDYMKLPPKEERISHHDMKVYWR